MDNGHVTLEGVVNTELQKQVAGVRASSTGLSFGPVVNNLRVENPPAHQGWFLSRRRRSPLPAHPADLIEGG